MQYYNINKFYVFTKKQAFLIQSHTNLSLKSHAKIFYMLLNIRLYKIHNQNIYMIF